MTRLTRRAAIALGALFLGGAARGNMVSGESGRVRDVVDGDTFFLDSGLKVRLSGIQAPKLPLGRAGYPTWPLAPEAKSYLEDLVLGKQVTLKYGGERRDRYDRALAQAYVGNLWVQEAMIKAGLSRAYPFYDTWQDTDALFEAERAARADGLGIWSDDYYDIRPPDPDPLAQDVDSYQIVEGFIVQVAEVRSVIYLNFGASWRTDFTVMVFPSHKRRFRSAGIDLTSLEGARVRVRGWIELENGPMIKLDVPERLEILS